MTLSFDAVEGDQVSTKAIRQNMDSHHRLKQAFI